MEDLATLNQPVKKKVVSDAFKITKPSTLQIPEGYVSLEEFRTHAHELVKNFCDKHGIS
jgi:hypothetical protein